MLVKRKKKLSAAKQPLNPTTLVSLNPIQLHVVESLERYIAVDVNAMKVKKKISNIGLDDSF